jgi:hypothetical protein
VIADRQNYFAMTLDRNSFHEFVGMTLFLERMFHELDRYSPGTNAAGNEIMPPITQNANQFSRERFTRAVGLSGLGPADH